MKLYHFLPKKWALEALKRKRIKVSRYEDLNDPFELLAMSLEDKASRAIMKETKEKINKRLRIICCSEHWTSPLLWGHYADKHQGIALELEVPRDCAQRINYADDRTSINVKALAKKSNEQAKLSLLEVYTTKFAQWSYEEEYRIQFTEDEYYHDGGHDFINFGTNVEIKGIVLGPLCKVSDKEIEQSVPRGIKINVTTSRTAFQSFRIVHQGKSPPFTVTGKGE